MLQLSNEFEIPNSLSESWELLLDVHRVAACVPGVQLERSVGDEHYGLLTVRLGSITLTYRGTARLVEVDADSHRLVLEGRGKQERGAGMASARLTVSLHPSASGTRVGLNTDLELTGRPAQMGRPFLHDVAQRLVNDFAANLTAAAGEGPRARPLEGEPVDILRASRRTQLLLAAITFACVAAVAWAIRRARRSDS